MNNMLGTYKDAILWIKNNTINGKGVVVSSKEPKIYPEVTGYFIPTLLEWGEKEMAINFARYLCSIQKNDGSWYDSTDTAPYIFDTAQILKGLLAIRTILTDVEENIKRACNWIISYMRDDGRLPSPSTGAWGDDENFCSEIIHVYCLSPLKEAGEVLNIPEYINAAYKILNYYKVNQIHKIEKFSLLSHFYAYVIEGLIDMGEVELARKGLMDLEKYQDDNGIVQGLNNVTWACSTGMFQIALSWYKLGELEKGNKIFRAACAFQNKSGGWFGSYSVVKESTSDSDCASYFPDAEISWANKFFLDALYYKEYLEFQKMSDIFLEKIEINDGRYKLIEDIIRNKINGCDKKIRVCDLGCGKGRYIKNLIEAFGSDDIEIYGLDISDSVMKEIPDCVEKVQGRLTNLPFDDEKFDVIFSCEALEHSINIEGALTEMFRVAKANSCIIIIDKPVEKLGELELYEWEQWIDNSDINDFAIRNNVNLQIINSVSYEGKDDGLFRAWILWKGNK